MSHYFALPLHSQMPSRKQHIDPFLAALVSSLQQQAHAEQPIRPTEQEVAKPSKPSERQTTTTTKRPVSPKNPVSAPVKAVRTFTPHFDAYETESSYHLYGEFPGLSNKKAINIEFSDLNSITISGSVERSEPIVAAATKSLEEKEKEQEKEKEVEESETEIVEVKSKEEEEEKDDKDDTKSVKSLQPYVEDTEDEDDISIVSHVRSRRSSAVSGLVSPTTKSEEDKTIEKALEKVVEKKEEEKEEEKEAYKTWINERKFGEFQRTFSFPTPVELDEVTAKLDNGLLTIVVPKKKFVGRKVLIE
ncbi:hypothetical protein BZA77DRAFT_384780 [Pyronema omphalodes]|nr:hypothetical protein BZA77DRAFT_384780 [Pyronema omphalodes]